ncbi:hypothetical protein CO026_02735 [Candidatus Kaiserbacteria bacterium CG_4_9_14_0_2_um_filter_41_32]|uniref:Methyltransferase FkbM domain-containing protein n=2 Tax=Patescibacteria group TaxID=1783273 RepID=A0A2M8FED2_9BACT|nr:MAG: hypothetical protein COV58_03365 [Candidatus Roizmanbacteria bacterium CG11_big_fil_rev_8_21_14_0_20_36_8]PJC55996.1 MAG: hypothetical protein CO026_02735 [Candidatus Kaiserbacteria bacterium CG_4_9_14_0_2_um_filter_41_32]
MTIKKFLIKLWNWFGVMFTTSTLEGPFLYFQRVYFLLTFTSLVGIFHTPTGKKLRAYIERHSDKEAVIKNSLGIFSVNGKNDSLTKSITSFEYGHQAWLDKASTKNIFLDIGANIGFYSILALKKYGYSESYAFEPNPDTFERLSKNVTLNELMDKVHLIPAGLSDKNSTAKLGTKDVHTGASSFVLDGFKHIDHTIDVPTRTLMSVVGEYNIDAEQISFIKIDVEGYEYPVLLGMKEIFPRLALGTCLFIEIHPHAKDAEATKTLLAEAGFNCIASTKQHNFLYQK